MATGADPLASAPPPAPSSASANKKITCEFCECKLTPNGEYLELSEKAKGFRGHAQTKETLDAEIVKLRGELAAANNKILELEAKQKTKVALPFSK